MIAFIMTATIAAMTSGFDGKYFTEPTGEYYLSTENKRGQWFGGAAKKLGLSGFISPDSFKNLLAGYDANGTKTLVSHRGEKRVPGVDICFSAPKSVSALWAASDAQMRKAIELCIRRSVQEVLRFIEDRLKLVRRGRGGVDTEQGKIAAAIFEHSTNRSGDPNLHIHAVILNLILRADGKFAHVHTKELFTWTRTLGPMFRATLAKSLRNELGLELTRPTDSLGKDKSWFEVKGVPEDLCRAWSSRRAEIEKFTNRSGEALGNISAQARSTANRATRKSKKLLPSISDLNQEWEQVAKEHGFTTKIANALRGTPKAHNNDRAYRDALRESLKVLTNNEAHFTYRDLLRNLTERLQHIGLSAGELVERLDKSLHQSQTLITLAGEGADRRLTTKVMWELENDFLKNVETLQETKGARVNPRKQQKVLRDRSELSSDQIEAIRDLTESTGSIRILHGIAGAGKSYAMEALREAFTKSGYQVKGGALSAIAKEELEKQSKIESRTVASYLWHLDKSLMRKIVDRLTHDLKQIIRAAANKHTFKYQPLKLDKKTVLVIDEAGMLDTKSMNRLLKIAIKARATVVLVGDDSQLQPINAGGPFHHLLKNHKAASLTENWRQKDLKDREAVKDIREGRAAQALKSYQERGRVTVASSRQEAAQKLVERWRASGGVEHPRDHIIFTETRLEAKEVNRLCQQERLKTANRTNSACLTHYDEKFFVGDRVLFRKADRTRGVENGYRGTVTSLNRLTKTMRVQLDTPKEGKSAIVQVPLRSVDADAITLGDAATTHKGQGTSVANAYVLMGGGMSDRNMAYVQLSRGKESTHIFLDEHTAGPDLVDIAQRIGKDRTKTLAHEHAKQLEQSQSF